MQPPRQAQKELAWLLASALFLARLSPAHAEESHADYRYQTYQEDDDRIQVETHSVLFDVSMSPKIRLTGELVIDSISGATPSGAPAYKDWNTSAAQFSQEYAENNFGYLRPYFPDAVSWTNYVNTDPGVSGQIQDAAAAYVNSFTNSPNYKSPKTPGTAQHEFRTSISLGLPFTFGHNSVTPQFSYSKESDYRSTSLSVNWSRDFNDKNTTLTLGWSHDFDDVFDQYATVWKNKNTDTLLIGINQLIDSKTYLTFNFTYGHSSGYMNDQYRGIYAANALLAQDTGFSDPDGVPITMVSDGWRPERRPGEKQKYIAYLSMAHFFTPVDGSADVSYRYYHDTYGVDAHTINTEWHQKVAKKFVLSPGFRYYHQTAAEFYHYMVPDYQNWPEYYSSDYRLSEFQSFTYSLRLTWRVGQRLSLDATYSHYVMYGLDGVTADTAYPSANVFGIGARLWF